MKKRIALISCALLVPVLRANPPVLEKINQHPVIRATATTAPSQLMMGDTTDTSLKATMIRKAGAVCLDGVVPALLTTYDADCCPTVCSLGVKLAGVAWLAASGNYYGRQLWQLVQGKEEKSD